jgi:enamine deaminase RidA (YjgF/YER057c/UK114 family)
MPTKTTKNSSEIAVSTRMLAARSEHVITIHGDNLAAMNAALAQQADALNASIVSRFVLADHQRNATFQSHLAASDGSVIWLHGNGETKNETAAMQAIAVSGIIPTPVFHNGRDVGFTYEDAHARYCRINGVAPADTQASHEAQTRSVFETMDAILNSQGFRFTDTVRTWFYMDKMLDWYAAFNTARTAFFTKRGVFEKMVPASTGIGASNPHGAALTGSLLAAQPTSKAVRIEAVNSPLQGSALSYRSSFSRAVEMAFPTHRNLIISGTASIAPDGKTAHLGDVEKQIELTMQVVTTLLESRGMNWKDAVRGIAYFADIRDVPLLEKYFSAHSLPRFSLAITQATVCRADLLFELELDALHV